MAGRDGGGDHELERRLATRARSQGALRAAVARVAARLVARRAWEPLGYARLSDYARERLGKSARNVYEEAAVGEAFARAPALERILASGELPWTKVRALARLPTAEAVDRWLPHARSNTAATLDREIRRVEHCADSLCDEDREPLEVIEIPCTKRVRGKWHYAVSLARNVAGYGLAPGAAAEMIAAEVLAGLEVDEHFQIDDGDVQRALVAGAAEEPEPSVAVKPVEALPSAEAVRDIAPFLAGLDTAPPAELDRRLRALLGQEQRHEAELGPLLARVARRRIYRALGFASVDAYARERLGMDPAKVRALLRLERAAVQSPALESAYRSGALSWVAAEALVPVILADSPGRFGEDWVALAKRVTVRRLRDDVERALLVYETDPETWSRTGALPDRLAAEERAREIGAHEKAPEPVAQGGAAPEVLPSGWVRLPNGALIDRVVWRLLGDDAQSEAAACDSCLVRFRAPRSIAALFRAVHACVHRGLGGTPGEALEAMLDHVIRIWGRRYQAGVRVYARDGWRCAIPGCSSRQSLHDHHIVFRSAGGADDLKNRLTLCAWHHLRGVHQRLVRITGEAPHHLVFELPLETFTSGDYRPSLRSAAGA